MRTRKTVVILISGKAGSGKSTIADLLEAKLKNLSPMTTFRYALAGPIKHIAQAFIGWDGAKDDRGRKLLQDLGKVGREYNTDIWVKHLLTQMGRNQGLFPFNFVIVDDWRFPNELAYIASNPILDVVSIRVFGRGGLNGEVSNDVSENSLPEATAVGVDENSKPYYDHVIINDDDLNDLEKKVDVVLSEISKKFVVE